MLFIIAKQPKRNMIKLIVEVEQKSASVTFGFVQKTSNTLEKKSILPKLVTWIMATWGGAPKLLDVHCAQRWIKPK